MNDVAPAAYLDANVFIDALEGSDEVSQPIKELFVAGRSRPGILVTSELTLAEVLGPSRGQTRPAPLTRLYLDLMVWSRFIDLRPVSRTVLYETVELRKYATLKLPDAIHLATAILTDCSFFISRDQHFNRLPDWMEKIEPSPHSLTRVIGVLNG